VVRAWDLTTGSTNVIVAVIDTGIRYTHQDLAAQMWRWYPVLRLKQGARYTLHLSSLDLNHGFSLFPVNLNFQVVPGYDYGLTIVPNAAGDFRIVCNEFCGINHHMMVGKVVVESPGKE